MLKKLLSIFNYLTLMLIIFLIADVIIFRHLLGFGYEAHYDEENLRRHPVPYVMFTGKPNSTAGPPRLVHHNEYGFRGQSFNSANEGELKIAFFGGSTGYLGTPPIAEILQDKLNEKLCMPVFVANLSVTSSNHRQHLHAILEFLPQFNPDVIVFYGGHNETIQSIYYDPRPGYPFNHFYRAETPPILKLFLKHSALAGEIDKKYGFISGLTQLRSTYQPLSEQWLTQIVDKYLETLELADRVTSSLNATHLGSTEFFAFYQPHRFPEQFSPAHESILDAALQRPYLFDVSSAYDDLGEHVWVDLVHVTQDPKYKMAKIMANTLADNLQNKGVKTCL